MSTRSEPGDERNQTYELSGLPTRQAGAGRRPSEAAYEVDDADPPKSKSTREYPRETLVNMLAEREGR